MNFISSFIDLIHKEEYLKINCIIMLVIILIVPSTSIIYVYRPNLFSDLELAKLFLLIFTINVLLFLFLFVLEVFIKSLIINKQNYRLTKLNKSINKELWLDDETINPAYKSKLVSIYNLKAIQTNSCKKLDKEISLTDIVIDVFAILVLISFGTWFIKCASLYSESGGTIPVIFETNLGRHLLFLIWLLGGSYIIVFMLGILKEDNKQTEIKILFNKIINN